jgi:hypothetical protein
MGILLTILGITIVILVTFIFFTVKSYIKIKKSRSIQFSRLLDAHGDHGMVKMTDPSTESGGDVFYMEFKVVSKAKRVSTSLEYLNICVTNVSFIDLKDGDGKTHREGMQLLYDKQWIHDSAIYWFTDNIARKRDDIITDLLKDKKMKNENT